VGNSGDTFGRTAKIVSLKLFVMFLADLLGQLGTFAEAEALKAEAVQGGQ
jgi:hypothetical protein